MTLTISWQCLFNRTSNLAEFQYPINSNLEKYLIPRLHI